MPTTYGRKRYVSLRGARDIVTRPIQQHHRSTHFVCSRASAWCESVEIEKSTHWQNDPTSTHTHPPHMSTIDSNVFECEAAQCMHAYLRHTLHNPVDCTCMRVKDNGQVSNIHPKCIPDLPPRATSTLCVRTLYIELGTGKHEPTHTHIQTHTQKRARRDSSLHAVCPDVRKCMTQSYKFCASHHRQFYAAKDTLAHSHAVHQKRLTCTESSIRNALSVTTHVRARACMCVCVCERFDVRLLCPGVVFKFS